jgi:hypothetical protein
VCHIESAIAQRDNDHERLAKLNAEQEAALNGHAERLGAALAARDTTGAKPAKLKQGIK